MQAPSSLSLAAQPTARLRHPPTHAGVLPLCAPVDEHGKQPVFTQQPEPYNERDQGQQWRQQLLDTVLMPPPPPRPPRMPQPQSTPQVASQPLEGSRLPHQILFQPDEQPPHEQPQRADEMPFSPAAVVTGPAPVRAMAPAAAPSVAHAPVPQSMAGTSPSPLDETPPLKSMSMPEMPAYRQPQKWSSPPRDLRASRTSPVSLASCPPHCPNRSLCAAYCAHQRSIAAIAAPIANRHKQAFQRHQPHVQHWHWAPPELVHGMSEEFDIAWCGSLDASTTPARKLARTLLPESSCD